MASWEVSVTVGAITTVGRATDVWVVASIDAAECACITCSYVSIAACDLDLSSWKASLTVGALGVRTLGGVHATNNCRVASIVATSSACMTCYLHSICTSNLGLTSEEITVGGAIITVGRAADVWVVASIDATESACIACDYVSILACDLDLASWEGSLTVGAVGVRTIGGVMSTNSCRMGSIGAA